MLSWEPQGCGLPPQPAHITSTAMCTEIGMASPRMHLWMDRSWAKTVVCGLQ